MKQKTRIITAALLGLGALATLAALALFSRGALFNQASASNNSEVITSGRPLYDAADLLEGLYAKPVTYEDPIVTWAGDISPEPPRFGLYPRTLSFSLPDDIRPGLTPILDAYHLGKVLDAYSHQTDGPRFRISASRWGLHILPAQARNAAGRFVESTSPLDTRISVPLASRTPSEHFHLICDALTNSAGIRVKPLSQPLEAYFVSNGLPPHPGMMTDEDKERISFAWGATDMIAREALISLLDLSGTTLSWRLWFNPEPWNRYCILILKPIEVAVADSDGSLRKQPLLYDRCKKCPPLRPLIFLPDKK